jgi:ATP-dependent Clp protease protease subunit
MGLKIDNASNRAIMYVYGSIGGQFGGITADEFRQALDGIPSKQDIEIRIDSDGGDYLASIAMHANLMRRTGKVITVVDGLAASGASIIAMAGTHIAMAEGSWMMIHEAHGGMEGTADQFRDAAKRLDATNAQLVSIYAKRYKGTEKELRNALAAETWLTAEDAVNIGLADEVSETMAIAAHVDADKFKYVNVPQPLLEARGEQTFPRLDAARSILDEILPRELQQCDST